MTVSVDSPAHCDQLVSTGGRVAERVFFSDMPQETIDALTKIQRMNDVEVCGFLTNRWVIDIVDNVHREPTHNFFMGPESVRDAVEEIYDKWNESILGIWHTHPNNVHWPSPRDILGWPNLALAWRYFVVTSGEVLEWKL